MLTRRTLVHARRWRTRGSAVLGRGLVRRIACVPHLLLRWCSHVLRCSRMRNIPCLLSRLVRIVAGSRDVLRTASLLLIVRRSWYVLGRLLRLLRMIISRRTRHVFRSSRLLIVLRRTRHLTSIIRRIRVGRRPVHCGLACPRCFARAQSSWPWCRNHCRLSVVHCCKLSAVIASELLVLDLRRGEGEVTLLLSG